MKKILFFLLIIASAKAQTINKIECFIDTDPGFGLGVNVPITAATTINASFSYAVNSLTDGIHLLGIRSQDQNLFWSLTQTNAFYKETIGSSSALSNIVKLEYFINNDPGQGTGVDVPITAGTTINDQAFTYDVSSLTDGIHLISVRAKTANGLWSIVRTSAFYKETIGTSAALSNIVKLEYFIDNDPGRDLGTNIPITPATSLSNIGLSFNVNALTDGIHLLSIRGKSANNTWSVVSTKAFYKEAIVTPPALANIVKLEYFIDNDPGQNLGINVPITAGATVSNVSFNFNANALSNGVHKLTLRARDVNNRWGNVNIQDFTVQDNIVVIGGIPANWCKNTTLNIPFTASGTYISGNVYTAQLSNALGSFTTPTVIGTLTSTAASGTIVATIPNTVPISNGYKVRVISSSPVITNSPIKPLDVVAICQCLNNISLITGNWGTASIWSCGHIPLVTEPVQISTGHTVTLDINGVAKSLDLRGILNQQATKILTIQGN